MQLHDTTMLWGVCPDGTIVVHEGPSSTWYLGIVPGPHVRAQLAQAAGALPVMAGYYGTLVWGA